MQDDFNNRMGLPDDELTGGSAMGDLGDSGDRAENDMDVGSEPTGRPSGGARARKSTSGHKSSVARKAAATGKSSGARKAAGRPGARKAAKKSATRKGAMKAGAKKKGASKGANKSARRAKKKSGRRR
jgi:hypothetical protein